MNKYSKQREEVLNILKNSYSHPTAEEVYLLLKESGSKSSKSTVYRNLNLLYDKNIIKKISVEGHPDRHDYNSVSHNHVICTKCKKVYDFYYDFKKYGLVELIKNETGIDASLDNIIIEGICSSCQKIKE